MTFKLSLVTLWSKNGLQTDPKMDPKWTPKSSQNDPKLDLCLRPVREGPGGAKPYKTNEKPPRNLWGKKDGKRRAQGCHVASTFKCSQSEPDIESRILRGLDSERYDEALDNSAYPRTNTIRNTNTVRITNTDQTIPGIKTCNTKRNPCAFQRPCRSLHAELI